MFSSKIIVMTHKSITDLERELVLLEEQRLVFENQLASLINNAISRVVNAQLLHKIGKHCFTVSFSKLSGNPWSPQYYDWSQAAEVVYRYLRSKPVLSWKVDLQKKLEKTSPGKDVIFTFSPGSKYWRCTERIPIPRQLIEEILNQLYNE